MRTYGFLPTEDVVLTENRGTKKPVPISLLKNLDETTKGIVTRIIELTNEIETEEKANEFRLAINNCNTLEELSALFD